MTAWTTRVSNPVCSPCLRTSVSEKDGKVPSLNGSLSSICAFDFYSGRSPNLSFSRNNVLADWLSKVPALACFSRSLLSPTYPLRPIKTNNARTLCIAAAAGTELGRCFLPQVVSLSHPAERVLQSIDLHLSPSQIVAGSGFRPLPKIPHCCPHRGARALSQSRCG